MLFHIPSLIEFCSRSFTLCPGDVILTGTPWGCGAFAAPERYLRPGDCIEVSVEGIGSLCNEVRDAG
jgi:5-carboxymethyl-2-hydroxymuconate isomerase